MLGLVMDHLLHSRLQVFNLNRLSSLSRTMLIADKCHNLSSLALDHVSSDYWEIELCSDVVHYRVGS